jgi:hypothetical protein
VSGIVVKAAGFYSRLFIALTGAWMARPIVYSGDRQFQNDGSFGSRSMASSGYTHFWVLDQWQGHPVKRRNKNAIGADDAKRRHILPCDNANEYDVVLVP